MRECSAALQFPPRDAENWDAFEENLVSLEWIGSAKKTIVVLQSERVLCDADERERVVFFSILQHAPAKHAAEWLDQGGRDSVLIIVLQCRPEHADGVRQLLRRTHSAATPASGKE